MNKSYILLITFIVALFEAQVFQQPDPATLKSEMGGWSIKVNDNGAISKLDMVFNDELVNVPRRTDSINGPAWAGIKLSRVEGNKLIFEGRNKDQIYSIEYQDIDGELTVVAQLKNESSKPFLANPSVSLRLGIDNEMTDPITNYEKFFPTLLRCEKTHFWGYFQNPNGQILTISSPDAVASGEINYIGMGHRTATSTLNMLHRLPLPQRHPQELIKLASGEKRTCYIIIQPASSLDEVLPIVATNSKSPAIALWLSRIIHTDLVHGNATGWSFWTALNQSTYGDYPFRFNLILYQTNVNDPSQTNGTFYDVKNLWALGNFSRFVRQGMVRFEVIDSDYGDISAAENFMISGYINPTSKDVVLICVNTMGSNRAISFENYAKDFEVVGGNFDVYTTSTTSNLKKYTAAYDAITIQGKSIVTLKAKLK